MNKDDNRSYVDLIVEYKEGVHTTKRKKDEPIIKKETITLIVPHTEENQVKDYIQAYCEKKNMSLVTHAAEPFPGKRQHEFECQNCNELTINMSPIKINAGCCSEYCLKQFKMKSI